MLVGKIPMPQYCEWLTMQRNAGLLTIVCILLCFAFNYTFPLHRDIKWPRFRPRGNNTHVCEPLAHHTSIVDRTKKMASDLEDAMKKLKVSAQEVYHNAIEKKKLSDEDLRHYEQLVIMKKYPYLDLDQIDKYHSQSGKNTRQSQKDESGAHFDSNDPGICEPPDNMNVEVFNRGLSGFTIPQNFAKGMSSLDNKMKLNDLKAIQEKIEMPKAAEKSQQDGLSSLRKYIEAFLP